MASDTTKLRRTENWLKAGLALLITKEGLQDFVYDEIKQFQINSLTYICTKNGLSPGITCNTCSTTQILRCPTTGVCKVKHGTCKAHASASNQYRPCANHICDDFRDCIRNVHRYRGPSFKNTDATKWCSNVWDVAKCFMPADGYSQANSVAETDINGVLSVVINHNSFQKKMTDDLSQPNNNFCQVREVSKRIRHSPDFELDTPTLTQYFQDLANLLSDSNYLRHDKKAQAALAKLHQLQNDTLFTRVDDVKKVLDDAASVLQNRITTEADKHKHDILTEVTGALSSLQTEKQNCLDAVANTMSSAISKLHLATEAAKDTIMDIARTEGDRLIQIGKEERTLTEETFKDSNEKLSDVSKDEQRAIKDLGNEIRESIKDTGVKEKEVLENVNRATEAAEYESFVTGLQQRLVNLYKDRCRYLPISPLLKDEEELLDDFYVRPSMQRVEHHKSGVKPVSLKSYEGVFFRDGQMSRRIFVTGDAGTGKTVFCQRMVLAWCKEKPHSETTNSETIYSTVNSETIYSRVNSENVYSRVGKADVDLMKKFKFLFFVSLRDAKPDECYIHELISTQLEIRDNSLIQVLQKENCLILVDGLDEWDHPINEKCKQSSGHPHLDYTEACTIVSTTRPWKLEVLQLGKGHIDHKIEITGFQNPVDMRRYVGKVIKLLNERTEPEGKMTTAAFEEKINDIVDEDVKTNPLIVLNLICLWFMGKSLGPSKCKIYSDSLEMMLTRSSDRDGDVLCNLKPSDLIEKGNLISVPKVCFKNNPKCQEHLSTLYWLAQLAFKTLFGDSDPSSLVFGRSVGRRNGLSSDQIEILCKIGILSRSKVVGNLLSRETKISFIHKTYHEFFAALYISFTGLSGDSADSIAKRSQTVEKIVEMQNVFIFLSGMAPYLMEKLDSILRTVINKDPYIKFYRRMIFHTGVLDIFEKRVNKAVWNLEAVACKCYRECRDVVGTELRFPVEDFYIGSQSSAEKLSLLKLSSVKSVLFDNAFTDDVNASSLEKVCMLVSVPYESLNYKGKTKFNPILNITEKLLQNLTCIVLDFGSQSIKDSKLDEPRLLSLLQSDELKQLEVFSLENQYFSKGGIHRLNEILRKCKHLKKLRLANIFQHCVVGVLAHFDCSCFLSLEELTLFQQCQIDIAVNNSKLERCCIQNSHHSSSLSSLLAPRLQTLIYYRCVETDVLASALFNLTNLIQLDLMCCSFSKALLLNQSMKHLKRVSLREVVCFNNGFKNFIDSIPFNESPIHVVLLQCQKLYMPIIDSHIWIHDIVSKSSRFQIAFKDKTSIEFNTKDISLLSKK